MSDHSRRTSEEFEQELQELRRRIIIMAERVNDMTAAAINALLERDNERAAEVILADREVNRDEMETDELCMLILARRQPMASDLRFITTAMKMVTDLERIGDLAVNVAERTISLKKQPQLRPYIDIPKMGDAVREMLTMTMEAFLERDTDKARAVIDMDDTVDELYALVFKDVLEVMYENHDSVKRGIDVQSIAKYLERMADHVTNLSEQVIYLVEGKDIRHAESRQ